MGWPHGWYGSGAHGTVVGVAAVCAPAAVGVRRRVAPARPAERMATSAMPEVAAITPALTTSPGPRRPGRRRRRRRPRPGPIDAPDEPGGATVVGSTRTGVVRAIEGATGAGADTDIAEGDRGIVAAEGAAVEGAAAGRSEGGG